MQEAEIYRRPPTVHEQLLNELYRLRDDDNVSTFYAEDGAPEKRVKHRVNNKIYEVNYTYSADHLDYPTITLQSIDSKAASQTFIIDQDTQLSTPHWPISAREPVEVEAQLEILQQLRQLGPETQIVTIGTLQKLAKVITKNCEAQELIVEDTQSKQTQCRKPLRQTPDSPSVFSLKKVEELEVDKQVLLSLTAYWTGSDRVERYTLLSYTTTPGGFATEYRSMTQTGTGNTNLPHEIDDLFMEQEVQQLLDWVENSETVDATEINIEPQ